MKIEDWGLIDYRQALLKQIEKVKAVQGGFEEDCIIFCSHLEVVTLGRKSSDNDLVSNDGNKWNGETIEIQRGGRATYHGPSQLVIYPIISLLKNRRKLKSKDVHGYLRLLESIVINVLQKYNVDCSNSPSEKFIKNNPADEYTGVWTNGSEQRIEDKKIASIGIGVKKWVTIHGIALNLESNKQAFRGMSPCGFKASDMVSLEKILGQKIDREDFKLEISKEILTSLEAERI